MFFKIGFVKNFANFTGKHLCWSLFNKVSVNQETPTQCFPVKIAKFLRTLFYRTPQVAASKCNHSKLHKVEIYG